MSDLVLTTAQVCQCLLHTPLLRQHLHDTCQEPPKDAANPRFNEFSQRTQVEVQEDAEKNTVENQHVITGVITRTKLSNSTFRPSVCDVTETAQRGSVVGRASGSLQLSGKNSNAA